MHIYIWSFGKQSSLGAYASLLEDYRRRLPSKLSLTLELFPPLKGNYSVAEIRKKETAIFLQKMGNLAALYIIMDERGREWDSSQVFARYLEKQMLSYTKIVFLVGGAFGFDAEIFANKYPVYCLGKLTLPRYLVILLLSEQIYRASTILHNQPYHH